METCPNCGSRVYKLGCVNCDEMNYINEQEALTAAQYPDAAPPRRDASRAAEMKENDDLTRGDRERLSRRPLAAASEGRSTRDA